MAIIHGKGKEWSEVARETEGVFYQWLGFSGMSEGVFLGRISQKPYRIEETKFDNGDRSITVYAGFRPVGEPLLWEAAGAVSLEDFHCNAILMLFFMAGKCPNKDLEREVDRFGKTLL